MMAAHLKVVLLLVLGISSALSSPHPDFSIQPGDQAHDHHHEHHHHDHEEDGEPLAPPPPEEEAPAGSSFLPPENPQTYGGATATPAPAAPIQKECKLVRETTNSNSPMCFLEPECESKCQQVPKETCTNFQKEQCQTYNEQVCNTVYEQKC